MIYIGRLVLLEQRNLRDMIGVGTIGIMENTRN
jgi:hypothetical protein